jgi:hypothetical protein
MNEINFQKHLELLKHLYADETIAFTDLLIEYATEIPCPNTDPEIYINQGIKLYTDERLTKIVDLAKYE